jgi:FKBP-type peptidyl-prolyl cis-trans isomerase FkpA
MFRLYTYLVLVLILAVPGFTTAGELETEDQKTLYALGIAVGSNLASFNLSEEELALVQEGVADQVLGRPAKVDARTYQSKIRALGQTRQLAAAEKEKAAGQTYRAAAEKEADVVKTDTGLLYKELQAGTGDASPQATDTVKVHYHGTTIDGTVFDSSVDRGQPATFPLGGVIPCWTEGVQKMKVGSKARLICPPEIAYGDRGSPPRIKPGATLVFEVELFEIVKKPDTPAPATQ